MVLLAVIYIAFIGLGIPDSIFGAAWPAIYSQFGLPVSVAGYISMLSCACTIFSSLMSTRLINKFGTGVITAVSTAMTALGLLGYSLSGNVVCFFLLSVPMGLGAGAIDSGLNNFVALHYSASQMNYLHSFYGIGVSLSPYIMSVALSFDSNWQSGFRFASIIQLIITVITFASLPLWKKKVAKKDAEIRFVPKTLSLMQMLKNPAVICVWILFLSSCAIEFVCGIWGSTFLVNSKQMSVDMAAGAITFYYIGITLGRFFSGLLSKKLNAKQIVYIGTGCVFGALIIMALPPGKTASLIGLFLIGMGNGPIFPNMVHLTPDIFGREVSQSIVGSQLAAAYVGIMIIPTIFGKIINYTGTDVFVPFLIGFFVLMAASVIFLFRKAQKGSISFE